MTTVKGFIHVKIVQHNIQYHGKVLLSCFHSQNRLKDVYFVEFYPKIHILKIRTDSHSHQPIKISSTESEVTTNLVQHSKQHRGK